MYKYLNGKGEGVHFLNKMRISEVGQEVTRNWKRLNVNDLRCTPFTLLSQGVKCSNTSDLHAAHRSVKFMNRILIHT